MTDREKAIVMAYTGYTMLSGDKLCIYYKYVQEKLGRSVMTHELAYQEVQDAIKETAKEDFIAIAKADNGWVSVKDGLPQKLTLVLVCNHGIYDIAFVGDRGNWVNKLFEPEYWMPLPEPPKEVSE